VDQLEPAERVIIQRATRLDPSERFCCCQELAQELRRAAGNLPIGHSVLFDTRSDHSRITPIVSRTATSARRSWEWPKSDTFLAMLGIVVVFCFLLIQFVVFKPSRGPANHFAAACQDPLYFMYMLN